MARVSAWLSKKIPRWVKHREEKTWSSCNHSGRCHVVPVFNKLPRESGVPLLEPHIRFPKCLHTFTSESEIICLHFTYPSQLLRILCCWFSVINTRQGLSGQPCGWSCALGGSRRPGGPLFTFLNPAAGTRPGPATSCHRQQWGSSRPGRQESAGNCSQLHPTQNFG